MTFLFFFLCDISCQPSSGYGLSELSGQTVDVFSVDRVEMERKPQQHFFSALWEFSGNCKNFHQAALKMAALFGSTYLSESASSDMTVKFRTRRAFK